MAVPDHFSFIRYLEAKKAIDDRSLNSHVWRTLTDSLPVTSRDRPLRVLEAGAGIGTMIERMVDMDLFSHATYTAVDTEKRCKTYALERLDGWSGLRDLTLTAGPDLWRLTGKGKEIEVCFRDEDIFDFAAKAPGKYDLLIANAFLDLVDIPTALPVMLNMLDDGGIFYFSINFDGMTLMEPVIDPGLDRLILDLYHRSMDERVINGKRSGDSRTGRRLFAQLNACGACVTAAGGSDWVVYAGPDGYPGDEAYFLYFIVHLMHETLKSHPAMDPGKLERWVAERHRQVESGELVYIAHQVDLAGKKS